MVKGLAAQQLAKVSCARRLADPSGVMSAHTGRPVAHLRVQTKLAPAAATIAAPTTAPGTAAPAAVAPAPVTAAAAAIASPCCALNVLLDCCDKLLCITPLNGKALDSSQTLLLTERKSIYL